MNRFGKPIAFVDESGFIVPNPTFNKESSKHIKGTFIYTQQQLVEAVEAMNRRQDERRMLADNHFGSEAIRAPADYEVIGDVIEDLAGQRETIPSLDASPTRPRKTNGKSMKLSQPNVSQLPETLNVPQQGVNLTPEERADLQGIDVAQATREMFGKQK